ncbi:MAG: DUF1700 domain-containing protein [Acutalibacter sp.]
MKEHYIRQVGRHLSLPRKQKREVLRDLEEIFASALEHGESESQVITRLGSPKEYAQEVEAPLDRRRSGGPLVGLAVSCGVCVGAVALFLSTQNFWIPDDAIGYAQGSTSIQLAGGIDLSPLLLILAAAGLVGAVWFAWRLHRMRKG